MNRMGPVLFVFLILVISLGGGCSKPRVELAVASQPNANPDHSGRPSPVIVRVMELRNDLAFKQADFQTLFDSPLQILGADLIASDELVFIPGEARRVAYQPNPNTRFVGIVAGFRQMDRALWRVIKPVDPEEENWLSIELNDATILVVPDKEAEGWDPEQAVRQFRQQLIKPRPQAVAEETAASARAGTMPPAQPAAGPAPTEPGTPGGEMRQEAKEAVTIIRDGVETLSGGQGADAAPSTSPPSAMPNSSAPSLPAMRPF